MPEEIENGNGLLDQIQPTSPIVLTEADVRRLVEEFAEEEPISRPTQVTTVPNPEGELINTEIRRTRRIQPSSIDNILSRWSVLSSTNEAESTSREEPDTDPEITTIDDKKMKASEAILYDGYYYSKEHKYIFKCSFSGELNHKDRFNPIVVGMKPNKDNSSFELEFGFVLKKYNEFLPLVYSGKHGIEKRFLNDSIIDPKFFKQSSENDLFVDADRKEIAINQTRFYPSFKSKFKELVKTKVDKIKYGIESPTNTIAEGLPYTMGIEIEVCRGFIPTYLAHNNFNLSCVRDGSINNGEGGPEYVTGVLKGDAGFKHLQEICYELSKNCKINHTCGVHVHLGNIDFTKQFLVNSYVLALLIEDELFSFLPQSRRNNRYCRKLKPLKLNVALTNSKDNYALEEDYNKLFKYISYEKVNNPDFNYNKDKQHPLGPKCGYNHDTPRYCWLNYVPAMFNTRGNKSYSLEIRNHSGTTNFTKIKNWTLLFMAIVAFTERYPELIKPGIRIDDIIDKIFPKKAASLKLYFKTRQSKFTDDIEDQDSKEENVKRTIKELIKE
jgi:hypothetical protein